MKSVLLSGAVLSLVSFSSAASSEFSKYKCLHAYQQVQRAPSPPADEIAKTLALRAAQRIHILCEIRRAVKDRYTLLDLKKERLHVDVLQNLDDCILAEPEEDEDDAVSNLFFEDRVRRCLATAKDTHLKMYGIVPRPFVYTGLAAVGIEGKYYVSSVDSDLIRFLDRDRPEPPSRFLVPGAEILEVDGHPVNEHAKLLSAYVSGSSGLYLEEQAVTAVFERDFLYPEKNLLALKVASPSGETAVLQIPWWYTGMNLRADAREYFRRKDIKSTVQAALPGGMDRMKIAKTGYASDRPLFPQNIQTFYADSGRIGLRLGFAKSSDDFACYAQLLTFDTDGWRVGAKNGAAVPALLPLQQFVANCKKNKKKFILDLRNNEGGAKIDQSAVLALFAEQGRRYPSHFFTARITPSVASVIQKFRVGHDIPMGEQDPFSKAFHFDALENALRLGQPYLPALASKFIEADPAVGGYDEKMVALVSPDCISGGDILADLLKKSGRARLIGTHSNGTGAGVFGDSIRHLALWEDPHEFLRVKIPNYLFGVFEKPATQAINDFEGNKYLISENRPIAADIHYSTALEDLTGEGAGWARKALETLATDSPPLSGSLALD